MLHTIGVGTDLWLRGYMVGLKVSVIAALICTLNFGGYSSPCPYA